MAHVGIQCFRARERQNHRTQAYPACKAMVANEDQGVIRVEAVQNRRVEQDAAYAQYRQSGKPQQHDGAKHHADFLAAKALNGKQNHQNGQRQRQNGGMPIGIDDGQTFGSR